jgi:hypothetical protein
MTLAIEFSHIDQNDQDLEIRCVVSGGLEFSAGARFFQGPCYILQHTTTYAINIPLFKQAGASGTGTILCNEVRYRQTGWPIGGAGRSQLAALSG